eukprot:gene51033-19759_t
MVAGGGVTGLMAGSTSSHKYNSPPSATGILARWPATPRT